MKRRQNLVVVVATIQRESIQTLAVTLPIPLAKKWLLANGIRCVDKIVVAAARVVADAANPKSMGRQVRKRKQELSPEADEERLCGCHTRCDEHLYQITEPVKQQR